MSYNKPVSRCNSLHQHHPCMTIMVVAEGERHHVTCCHHITPHEVAAHNTRQFLLRRWIASMEFANGAGGCVELERARRQKGGPVPSFVLVLGTYSSF